MMGGEISFRKLHDTFFAIIFVSRKMGNRIENWLKELKDDKIAIKVNFLFFEMGGQKFLMNEALPSTSSKKVNEDFNFIDFKD